MNKNDPNIDSINQQAAHILLASVFKFLRRNCVNDECIRRIVRGRLGSKKAAIPYRQFTGIIRAYEDMGALLATWFDNPRFLDESGRPVPLKIGRGSRTVSHLVRAARVNISVAHAIGLFHLSSSVRFEANGNIVPKQRVFVQKNFEIPRAALVIERFLETLNKNSALREQQARLLLERSCHVSDVDLDKLSAVMRDIKARGSAFMDSIDGELEGHRNPKLAVANPGDLGVLIFAWSRPARRLKRSNRRILL